MLDDILGVLFRSWISRLKAVYPGAGDYAALELHKILSVGHGTVVMYGNSTDVVSTTDFGEGRKSPPTRFRAAIELGQ